MDINKDWDKNTAAEQDAQDDEELESTVEEEETFYDRVKKKIAWVAEQCINGYNRALEFVNGGDFNKLCTDKSTYYWPFAIFLTHLIVLVGRYIWCLYWVEGRVTSVNISYMAVFCIVPFLFWMMSTMCEAYDTKGWKRLIFWCCVLNAVLTIVQVIWTISYNSIVIHLLKIRITEGMTIGMVLNFCRFVLLFSFILPFVIIFRPLWIMLHQRGRHEVIEDFSLQDYVDTRPYKDSKYDAQIFKDDDGLGRKKKIYERDLLTHFLGVGPSGTGKTSTLIVPFIIEILDKKCRNRAKRWELLKLMLDQKKVYVQTPVGKVTEYDIKPYDKYKGEYDKIYKRYPDAGITCVSPNTGIGDAVVELCREIGVDVNIIDPLKVYKESHVNHIGMNPFYVPLGLTDKEMVIRVINNSSNFSEILLAVNEALGAGGGGSDTYFRDLNTSVTTNIASIVMIYCYINNTYASIGMVQECINDFRLLYTMCLAINKYYSFGLQIIDPSVEDSKKTKDTRDVNLNKIGEKSFDGEGITGTSDGLIKDNAENFIQSLLKGTTSVLRPISKSVSFVNKELFMSESVMYQQSRGLRNLLDKMIKDPDIYEIMNQTENFVDYDKILNKCEITVVNTEAGKSDESCTSLGLFFLLNFANGVLRRPRDEKNPLLTQPHFLITDESAFYVHPWMSRAVNLWRQYKCSCLFSFQTLAQLESKPAYRDIHGSMLQVGNILAYGRLGISEMKIFSKLAGTRNVTEYQKAISKSSVMAEEPTENVTKREMNTEKENATESDVRFKRFKRGTWYRYQNGCVKMPMNVALDFADMNRLKGKGYDEVDWSIFEYPEHQYVESKVTEIDENAMIDEKEDAQDDNSIFVENTTVIEKESDGAEGELESATIVKEEVEEKASEVKKVSDKPLKKKSSLTNAEDLDLEKIFSSDKISIDKDNEGADGELESSQITIPLDKKNKPVVVEVEATLADEESDDEDDEDAFFTL